MLRHSFCDALYVREQVAQLQAIQSQAQAWAEDTLSTTPMHRRLRVEATLVAFIYSTSSDVMTRSRHSLLQVGTRRCPFNRLVPELKDAAHCQPALATDRTSNCIIDEIVLCSDDCDVLQFHADLRVEWKAAPAPRSDANLQVSFQSPLEAPDTRAAADANPKCCWVTRVPSVFTDANVTTPVMHNPTAASSRARAS